MQLDPQVLAIAKQFEPALPLDNWTDDNRRAWAMQVIEQVVFQFPEAGWGSKRADPGRPLSKDAIAVRRDGHLWAFDLVNGGTRRVYDAVEGEQIDGQVFVPIAGKDHLGISTPSPASALTPQPTAGGNPTLAAPDPAVLEALRAIQTAVAELGARLDRLQEASVDSRSEMNALRSSVQQVAAAISAPRKLSLKGGVLGTVVGTLEPPQV